MKNLSRLAILSFVMMCLSPYSTRAESGAPVVIAIVGDSTVSAYASSSPRRGWGQMLPLFLDPKVVVSDLAISGMSTKTFRATGNWEKALQMHPNFILIQFGHNDSHPCEQPEATDAAGEYADNLQRYVMEAVAAGAKPILVTPMHRRVFTANGKLTAELLPYAEAMRKVAKKQNIPLIDLYARSGELFEKLGETDSQNLTVSAEDKTHFTEKGAIAMASLVAKELDNCDPLLAVVVRPNQESASSKK